MWDQLRLDEFWLAALPPSREGTRWLNILKTLVSYQLISPGSEWRLHRHWFEHSAMGDLLGENIALVQPNNLYRCLDNARRRYATDVAMKIDGRTMIMKSGHHKPDLNSPAFKSESARSRAIWNYPAARGRNWGMATSLLADTDMTPSVVCSVAGESSDKLN